MKYKKYAALTLAAVLAGTTLAGCGTVEEPEPVVEEEIVAEVEAVEEPVEEEEAITVIGEQNASESVMMTNQMGGTIVGLAIKEPEDAQYPDNLMETDQWFMDGDQAMVYYEPPGGAASTVSAAEETVEITGTITGEISNITVDTYTYGEETEEDKEVLTEAEAVANAWAEANVAALSASVGTELTELDAEGLEGEAELLEGEAEDIEAEDELAETVAITEADLPEVDVNDLGYFLEVTMENNKVYEITCFPIDDMDEVTLCCDNDVAYLQYTSLSDGTVVNTKAVEIIIKNNKEAAEEVTALIAALPAVSELNAEAVAEQAAKVRVSYNNLTPAQRAYVTNLVHLEELENSIRAILGDDALDALIAGEELEDTDVINAEIQAVETYETWDTGGMAYRETEGEETPYYGDYEWDEEVDNYDYGNEDYGNLVSPDTDENGTNIGDSTVIDDGSSTVIDDGSSTIIDDGSSTVIDDGSGTVVDDGSGTVVDDDSSTVVDDGSGTVID